MLQPEPFTRLCQRQDGAIRHSGFLARTLICKPPSLVGTRFIQPGFTPTREGLDRFNARTAAILRNGRTTDTADHKLTDMRLDADAEAFWIDAYNEAEEHRGCNGKWEKIDDYAARIPEYVLRMAAGFEYFENDRCIIGLDMVKRAARVMGWFAREFDRIFGETSHLDDSNEQALALLRWMREWAKKNSETNEIPIREIENGGPRPRKRKDLEKIFPWFYHRQMISLEKRYCRDDSGRSTRKPKIVVVLLPAFFDAWGCYGQPYPVMDFQGSLRKISLALLDTSNYGRNRRAESHY
jgi:hypothetical protein